MASNNGRNYGSNFSHRLRRSSGDSVPLVDELGMILIKIGNCRASRIKPTAKLREDLGLDSFAGMEILVAIEKRYRIQIGAREIEHVRTFSDLVNFLSRRVGRSGNKVKRRPISR